MNDFIVYKKSAASEERKHINWNKYVKKAINIYIMLKLKAINSLCYYNVWNIKTPVIIILKHNHTNFMHTHLVFTDDTVIWIYAAPSM